MVHVDDGLMAGEEKILNEVSDLLMQKYKLEVSEVAGDIGDTVKFLKKEFAITDAGVEIKVSTRYLERICGILDIKRPRTRKTPCSTQITQPDYSEECDAEMSWSHWRLPVPLTRPA